MAKSKSAMLYLCNFNPMNMTSTFNRTPKISANFKKINIGLDFSSVLMYVDNIKVFAEIIDMEIIYIPTEPMKFGEHLVKFSISDSNGKTIQKEWSFIIDNPNVNYNFYYGIPHSHTSYSDGMRTPLIALEYAKSKELDFLFVTDHSNFLDGVKKNNYEYDKKTNQFTEKEDSQWYKTRIQCESFNKIHSDFLALRGFEMSSAAGHINVINSQSYVEGKKQIKSIHEFFKWLKNQNDIVVSINHPCRSFRSMGYTRDMDKIINLMEVGNGAYPRRYIRTEKYYYEALDMGWHFGAINGQDNHSDNWGSTDNLTVVLSESLKGSDFIRALKNRRTYSTETRSLKLTFKANNYFMGSIIPASPNDIINFNIIAEDFIVPINRLQLITRKGKLLAEKLCNNTSHVNWNISIKSTEKESWYVIKVIHNNNKWGISSPIFTKLQN